MGHTLVIDTGGSIVGVLSTADEIYTPYYQQDIVVAIRRIEGAAEIVTYSGSRDMQDLERFSNRYRQDSFKLLGMHTDMRSVVWSDRIWGESLRDTYSMHFPGLPFFQNSYEGSNQRDTYMTYQLWLLWKANKLKVVDGYRISL